MHSRKHFCRVKSYPNSFHFSILLKAQVLFFRLTEKPHLSYALSTLGRILVVLSREVVHDREVRAQVQENVRKESA